MKIIGICGPSCSGKSTISKYLVKKLDANILSTDQFYIEKSPKIYVDYNYEKIRTFERKELYDGNKITYLIDELIQKEEIEFDSMKLNFAGYEKIKLKKKNYLIVEGFLLFTYEKLCSKLDNKFYLDLPNEEIILRRKLRGGREKSDCTFEKIGLKEYENNGLFQKNLPDVYVIDAKKSIEEIKKEILNKIN